MGSCLVAFRAQNRDGLAEQAIHVETDPNLALRAVVALVRLSLEESLDRRKLHVVVEALVHAMPGRVPANHQPDLVVRHIRDVANPEPQTTAAQEEDCNLSPETFDRACH